MQIATGFSGDDIILHGTNIGTRRYLLFKENEFDEQEDQCCQEHQNGQPVNAMHVFDPLGFWFGGIFFPDIQVFRNLTHDAHNFFSILTKIALFCSGSPPQRDAYHKSSSGLFSVLHHHDEPDFHFTIYAVQLYHCSMDPEPAGT
jgi:hypothetical protein